MIVAVSIVDKHKPEGQRHVGTYMFEVDYRSDTHFDFMTVAAWPALEQHLRPYLGKLMDREATEAMDAAIKASGAEI